MKRRDRWAVMASIVLAMLVGSMDTTIANTTMPVIAAELGGSEWYAWTFASYMIFSTVVSPIAGRLSDLFGRKKVFAAGIVLFMVGSVLCGLSANMLQLVLFRALQGFGAGFMLPFPAIIAGDLFTVENRGKIQAFFSGVWGLSSMLAPVLGAFFVKVASWRWIFYINLPVGLVALLLLMAYKEVYEPRRARIDYGGAVIFAIGIILVLLATILTDLWWVYVGIGLAILGWFYRFETRHPSPIVPPDLLRHPPIAWMIVNSFLACASLFGTSTYIPMFLQEEGYSIELSGLALFGMSMGWMALSVQAGKWILRWGYKPLLIIGNGLLVLSGIMLAFLQEGTPYLYVVAALVVQGLAYGLIVTVSIIGAQQLVSPDRKGLSTSLQMFARNTGTAVGVTIMGAFLNLRADFYHGIRDLFLYGVVVSVLAFLTAFRIGRPEAMETVEQAGGPEGRLAADISSRQPTGK